MLGIFFFLFRDPWKPAIIIEEKKIDCVLCVRSIGVTLPVSEDTSVSRPNGQRNRISVNSFICETRRISRIYDSSLSINDRLSSAVKYKISTSSYQHWKKTLYALISLMLKHKNLRTTLSSLRAPRGFDGGHLKPDSQSSNSVHQVDWSLFFFFFDDENDTFVSDYFSRFRVT